MSTIIPLTPSVHRRSQDNPWHRVTHSPMAMAAVIWIVALLGASLTSRWWLPYDPLAQQPSIRLQGPSVAHWLGTDELGRDLFSRIISSSASAIGLGAITAIVGICIAVPAALAAARNGRFETVANRVCEVMLSIPGMVIILAFIAAFGSNMPLVMVLLGVLMSAGLYRVLLGQAKSVQHQLFVDAAAVDGLRPAQISFRHVLPNMATLIIVQTMILLAIGIMMQAGLAFIGFGPQPPAPTWGGLVQGASKQMFEQPWYMVPTGLVLAITVIAFNGLGDVLADSNATPPPLVALGRRRSSLKQAVVASSDPDVLDVKDLVVGIRGGPNLVCGVSLKLTPGRVLALVGESGCGKSVTSFSLLGLLSPGLDVRGGSIVWNGTDIATASEAEMTKIRGHELGYVSQEPMRALDPMFTIGTVLMQAIRRFRHVSRAEAKTIATELLTQVGIVDAEHMLKVYPHQLSGGMAQRVAIALALSGRPKALIADEPTTALDVTVQAEVLDLLRGLVTDSGMAMLLVTHNLGVVADIADDVAVMYAGQIVESGTTEDVLVHPEHPYTMALLAADPHITVSEGERIRLASIPGQVPAPADWTTGCRFAERCRFADEGCLAPVTPTGRAESEGLVRCARRDQVAGRESEWRTASTIIEAVPA